MSYYESLKGVVIGGQTLTGKVSQDISIILNYWVKMNEAVNVLNSKLDTSEFNKLHFRGMLLSEEEVDNTFIPGVYCIDSTGLSLLDRERLNYMFVSHENIDGETEVTQYVIANGGMYFRKSINATFAGVDISIESWDEWKPITGSDDSGGDVGSYLGAVDLLQIFEPGLYTIFTRNSAHLPSEVESLIESDSDKVSTYAMLKVSPYHLVEDDEYDYPVKNGGMQELTVQFYDDNWNVYSCVYTNSVFTDLTTNDVGEYAVMDDGWVKIADSRGMSGSSNDVDLSDYCTKEEIDKIHNDGIVTLKKNISFTVGENIITNDTPVILSNGWTKGSSGEYIHNSNLTNPLEVQINAAEGAIYYVEWDLDFDKATSQSSASVAIGDSYSQDTYFGKNHIEMIVKCEGGGSLYITPLESFNGSIANISCKPLTDGDGLAITQEFNGIYMDDVNADNYGRWNVILSDNAMLDTVNSTRSIAIGHSALNGCKGGNRNIAIGTFSMGKMSGGERNVSIGSDSMLEVKAATDNVSIGVGAMYYGANPTNNIAIGKDALQGHVDFENHQVNDSTIVGNVAIGYQAGLHTKANKAPQGSRNVFVGNTAGYANTTGYNNVGVGAGALQGNKTGHSNTCIGVNATVTDGKTKSIAIGYGSKATKSNQAVIGNSGVTETVLYGDLIVYGTDAVGRNVATEDYVDAKIADQPSGDGNADLSGYYTADEVDSLLNEKEFIKSKKTISVLTDNTIELTKNRDYILDEIESLLFTCDPMEVVVGRANEVYVFFKSGETPTTIEHDENTSIKWVGDDCNTDGIFTPRANTEYELSFKVIKITSGMFAPPYYIIARVGAC